MTETERTPGPPVALVTGAGARIGAGIARQLHEGGYNVLIHFNRSQDGALALAMALNTAREGSAHCLQADLLDLQQVERLAREAQAFWSRLDVLVNNASCFFPTPLGSAGESDWDSLFGCNVRAPFFLAQACAPALARTQGCILNILDIYARHALREYSLYTMSKAALANMTRALARELAPAVRVNGIAPGAILWPVASGGESVSEEYKQKVIAQTCLQRMGDPADIARAAWFLVDQASYVTGQILNVDGGRSLKL